MKILIPEFQTEEGKKLAELIRRLAFSLPQFNEGVLVTITTSTSGVTVYHGLGKKPQGFFVLLKRQAVDIWMNNENEATMQIFASVANAQVTLWVF